MTTTPITLYDLSPEPGVSPYAERVKIALTELGLPYTVRLEAGAASGASKSEEFLRLFRGLVQDPEARGTLPTIVDGDYKLTESLIIVEYLDKKYGKPENRLLPNDAAQHGKVKLFVETFQSQLISNTLRLIMADTRAALADAAKSTDAALKVLDNFIKVNGIAEGGNFFLGSKYSFAEVATTPFVWIAIIVLPQVGKYDMLQSIKANHLERLELWIEASLSRTSFKSTRRSEEQMLQTTGKYNKPLKD